MPRASRFLVEGHTYHLTHRCHDRRFLLKFKRERERYRHWLRIGAKRNHVSVYGYCITSNHTHVIVHVDAKDAVAAMMKLAAGVVAQGFNKSRGHEASVWEHPYQCTMIENGRHLLNCLRYVDLNMVRAGAVNHPGEWRWCGYDELVGTRKRYCILDLERLVQSLGIASVEELHLIHQEGIRERIAQQRLSREAHWTEGLAVGSESFVHQAQSTYASQRRSVRHECVDDHDCDEAAWVIREAHTPYGPDLALKTSV